MLAKKIPEVILTVLLMFMRPSKFQEKLLMLPMGRQEVLMVKLKVLPAMGMGRITMVGRGQ